MLLIFLMDSGQVLNGQHAATVYAERGVGWKRSGSSPNVAQA